MTPTQHAQLKSAAYNRQHHGNRKAVRRAMRRAGYPARAIRGHCFNPLA